MKITRFDAADEALQDPGNAVWSQAETQNFPLVPTPLKGNPLIKRISPFIEKSTDHGVITAVSVAAAHNGSMVAVYLNWAGVEHSRIVDLDEFVDGAAVMYPLTAKASAFTMGSPGEPVNAWYWKANLDNQAFDVVAEGYGTSGRHKSAHDPISCNAHHKDGRWHLVMSRTMADVPGRAIFEAGKGTRMAFAIWDGGNRERSGRKSFSGDFVAAPIDP